MSEPIILAWEWAWSQALWDSGRRFIGEGWPDGAEHKNKKIIRRAITDPDDLARTKAEHDIRWAQITAEAKVAVNAHNSAGWHGGLGGVPDQPLPEGHAENVALDMVEAELQRLRENVATLLRALTNLHRLMLTMQRGRRSEDIEQLYDLCMAEAKAAIDKAAGHAS